MKKQEPLARSKGRTGREQIYCDHIWGTAKLAVEELEQIRPFLFPELYRRLFLVVVHAAIYHDLGKLDSKNQDALHNKRKGRLPNDHRNAGTLLLLGEDEDSALMIYGHHAPGLPDLEKELKSNAPLIRPQNKNIQNYEETWEYTIDHLIEYLKEHCQIIGEDPALPYSAMVLSSLDIRIGEAFVTHADRNDAGGRTCGPEPPRWAERLGSLDRITHDLAQSCKRQGVSKAMQQYHKLCHAVYESCRKQESSAALRFVADRAGSGRLAAKLAYLLHEAIEHQLRHIIVVMPRASNFAQYEKELRDLLLLEDEKECPERIIAVSHSGVKYTDKNMREIAALWEAPVVVTTAEELFEALAANQPTQLRKLNQLPGSAIFFDEFQSLLPAKNLPLAWQWLTELSEKWGCKVLLGSGNPVRFWENRHFLEAYQGDRPDDFPIRAPVPLLPKPLQKQLDKQERSRVNICVSPEQLQQCQFADLSDLLDFVLQQPGPRIVVMDTRRAAALTALELERRGEEVYHLSNAFSPEDNDSALEEIQSLIESAQKDAARRNWTLVTTPNAVKGMELSFCTGFIRLSSCSLFLHTLSQISQNFEYSQAALWCFEVNDPKILPFRDFETSREVFQKMIESGMVQSSSPADLATMALDHELKLSSCKKQMKQLLGLERHYDFASLAGSFRVIENKKTFLTIVNPTVLDKLQKEIYCPKSEIQRGSVSLRINELEALQLKEIPGYHGFYALPAKRYDPRLLGYFKDLLG